MKKELIGYCAVDSGQVMIVDPCYVLERDERDDHDLYSYDQIVNITNEGGGAGELYPINGSAATCVVSRTFIGDGSFPVYAKRDRKGRIVSLTIEF